MRSLTKIRASPAAELAALYHRRWKIEEMFDEIKTHLCDGKKALRSKTPELVRLEFYAPMLTHAVEASAENGTPKLVRAMPFNLKA